VGFSIPTDDDTVRQVVEPKAPAIPSRWAAVERLTAAGIAVGISVTPLMVMVDAQAFARRARLSGASSAWVGGLRLLKNDPFYLVLARHGWLKALDKEYQAEVREALRCAMPPATRARKKATGTGPARQPLRPAARTPTLQPNLFETL
jgi:DNA repair photolyase